MFELIAYGGFVFFTLLFIEFIILLSLADSDGGDFGIITSLIIFAILMQFLSNANPLGFLATHWLSSIIGFLFYLVAGAGWATFKWIRFVYACVDKYKEFLAEFVNANNLPVGTIVIPDNLMEKWQTALSHTYIDGYNYQPLNVVPSVSKNKSRIVRWIGLWPFSMIVYFVKDAFVEAFNYVYSYIANFLQTIANNIYNNLK